MCSKTLEKAIWKAVFLAAANFICCLWGKKKKGIFKYAHAFFLDCLCMTSEAV